MELKTLCARRTAAFYFAAGLIALSALLLAQPVAAAAEAPASAADVPQLVLLPTEFALTTSAATQGLVVENTVKGEHVGQAQGQLTFTSSNPAVVKVEAGVARPVGNGAATITVSDGTRVAKSQVTVTGTEKPFTWSFRNHVEPVLTKAGCNSGACHGALAGKRGFKLSLRGYDPPADYLFMTRQARGRRVVLSDPGRSLILTKPTAAVPHKGGIRFAVDSPEYKIISQWIASGAAAPRDDDARVERLEILPAAIMVKPGMKQQLVVRAHYSDGHAEDVTRWAKFTSNNDSVSTVDALGLVQVTGHGEGVVNAWYQSYNVVSTVTVAYAQSVPATVFKNAPRRNFIDELVLAKLRRLNLPPSPPSSDGEFVRRAFLDTTGTLPTAAETRAFLADTRADKRDRLIEQLLDRPEFVDYWAYKWSDLLLVNSVRLRPQAMLSYYEWIRSNVADNTPWDEFARHLVTAAGNTLENGAANFFVLHTDPPKLAETVSSAFLGMSIGCAKCHNHPMEKWTNDQYYSMANLFSRVRLKDLPGGQNVVFAVHEGELLQPRTGKPLPPQPLDGTPVRFDDTTDRREALADWLVSPSNPYFSRAITNRIWANYFGVGLVENVDDLRLTNPASNKELMSAASQYLVEHDYDTKALMRAILQSHTYQRSSQTLPENATDQRFYSHYYPRRMMAEVLLDALSQVTGSPTKFPQRFPAGSRAIQLPDSNVDSYFLKSFGRAPREATCECERSAMPSMVQVLHLSNGTTLNEKLEAKQNHLEKLLTSGQPNEKIVEEAYLSALSRLPQPSEREQMAAALSAAAGPDRRHALEDVYWGILSSREFLFNH